MYIAARLSDLCHSFSMEWAIIPYIHTYIHVWRAQQSSFIHVFCAYDHHTKLTVAWGKPVFYHTNHSGAHLCRLTQVMFHTCICTYIHTYICTYMDYVGWKAAYSSCMSCWTSCSGSHSNWRVQSWSNGYRQSKNIAIYVCVGMYTNVHRRCLGIPIYNYRYVYNYCRLETSLFTMQLVEIMWKLSSCWLRSIM